MSHATQKTCRLWLVKISWYDEELAEVDMLPTEKWFEHHGQALHFYNEHVEQTRERDADADNWAERVQLYDCRVVYGTSKRACVNLLNQKNFLVSKTESMSFQAHIPRRSAG